MSKNKGYTVTLKKAKVNRSGVMSEKSIPEFMAGSLTQEDFIRGILELEWVCPGFAEEGEDLNPETQDLKMLCDPMASKQSVQDYISRVMGECAYWLETLVDKRNSSQVQKALRRIDGAFVTGADISLKEMFKDCSLSKFNWNFPKWMAYDILTNKPDWFKALPDNTGKSEPGKPEAGEVGEETNKVQPDFSRLDDKYRDIAQYLKGQLNTMVPVQNIDTTFFPGNKTTDARRTALSAIRRVCKETCYLLETEKELGANKISHVGIKEQL